MDAPEKRSGTEDVLTSERHFHDKVAEEERESPQQIAAARRVAERAVKLMGLWDELQGRSVLECACGTGRLTVVLAQRAENVSAFDISPECVHATQVRADREGLRNVSLQPAAMEALPYEDGTFDFVVGFFILHHLADMEKGIREVSRVLKPGGRAVFFETNAKNPILMFCRRHLAGRMGIPKLGTPDEHPLTDEDYRTIASTFDGAMTVSHPHFRFFGKLHFQLLGRLADRAFFPKTEAFCESLDSGIVKLFPFLRRYSYLGMVTLTRESAPASQ